MADAHSKFVDAGHNAKKDSGDSESDTSLLSQWSKTSNI
eukprot:CAMPEP_0194754230 /NCGR_PEP_ID=MMETSP0323_2-20130528/8192_1 /TAXON_ID=2866 ORGANISM="Crypthecodinium cohnii, Strain Seligo" /NCGR_SAMPLE_ID=MMETSP0323_2 /ASSEMBLY_ACC=CAM_ASM_000346 /LENGTH=38 /DNA_ID= /DNA_START= /DNA_END= /DNA_ORIENTATION=